MSYINRSMNQMDSTKTVLVTWTTDIQQRSEGNRVEKG